MKRSKDHKGARALLEAIIRGLDAIPGETAADIALTALDVFQEAGGNISPGAVPFIIGPRMGAPDPGRPAPRNLQLSDILKDPAAVPKVEEVMRLYVKTPPDLAAIIEALSRLKKLTQEAANHAAVVRIAETIIGIDRAGTARGLRENRARTTAKKPGQEGKIARKIEEFITILTQ